MNKYVIIGPPGAGKSTQSALLCQTYGFVRISVGDIFRWHLKNRTKLAARIHRFIAGGHLVPDEIVEEVIKNRLEQHDWNYGFVLDGYPASQAQAEFFLESFNVDGVILLEVSDEIAADRLASLQTCPSCGFDYNLIYHRPRPDRVCDFCGSQLGTASQHSLQRGLERVREYHLKTEPVIEAFRRKELVVTIPGTDSPEEIQARIRAELGLSSEALLQMLRSSR